MARRRWWVVAGSAALVLGAALVSTIDGDGTTVAAPGQVESTVLTTTDTESTDEPSADPANPLVQGLVGSAADTASRSTTTNPSTTTPSSTTTTLSTTSSTAESTSSSATTSTTEAPTTTPSTTAAPTTTTAPKTTAAPTSEATTTTSETSTTAGCHPAYVQCIAFFPGDALNCPDVGITNIRLHDVNNDPYGLDGDNDGIGCESN